MRLIFGICLNGLFLSSALLFAEPPKFRTDADGPVKANEKRTNPKNRKPDDQSDWFQLVEGQFPPEGSAHAVSGEIIQLNHLERRFQIRVDRNDSQDRGVWDLPLDVMMLPYGSIWYQGAPAALQDIPLGTHLHGLFYLSDPNDNTPLPDTANNRKTPEWEFRRCFRIEDDFTFHARQKQLWKIDSIDLDAKKLTATLQDNGQPSGQPKLFDLLTSTRVFMGTTIADIKAIQPGELMLFNLTWATLYGPGRITDMWLDEPARALVTANQLERHRNHIRERGLPGWVNAVDDDAQIVTMTFFGGVDSKLLDELTLTNSDKIGWPLSKEPENQSAPKGTIAVARESLMTYDPVNDRKGGNILDIKKIPIEPGSSGIQIRVKCDMMLEGYRPRRIVRFYPATWKVTALPKEEQFHGRE
ncbi:MAG: hypothetical protein NTU79_21580 [Planctomycetota bacterium]|nr:hypothetical protein [Planctomycetota bacterium]